MKGEFWGGGRFKSLWGWTPRVELHIVLAVTLDCAFSVNLSLKNRKDLTQHLSQLSGIFWVFLIWIA